MSKRDRSLPRPSRKARLHGAYTWDCEDCGVENITRLIAVDTSAWTSDEVAECKASLGIEPHHEFETVAGYLPEVVTCKGCGARFVSEDDTPSIGGESAY